MPKPGATQKNVYRAILMALATVAALWALGLILVPFAVPIAWALCIAAVTAKPYRWLVGQYGKPRLAALIMCVLTPVVLLVPLVVVGTMLFSEISAFDLKDTVETLEAALDANGSREGFQRVIEKGSTLLGFEDFEALNTAVVENREDIARRILGGPLAKNVASLLFAPFIFLFGFVVMLITQYFVYCESGRLRSVVMDLSPFREDETDRILETLQSTTSAALVGGVLVAVIQGALGSLGFAVAGLDSPVLWGSVMAAASLFPFGGTAFVWVPAGVYLLATGSTGAGWFTLAWGAVMVGTADNLLRPWLLARTGAKDIHPMMLFFAVMSGIGLFGISGIVFGPLLIALVTTVLRIYRERVGGSSDDGEPDAEPGSDGGDADKNPAEHRTSDADTSEADTSDGRAGGDGTKSAKRSGSKKPGDTKAD